MAKAKDAFRTISEVAEWLDTPTHVLRFWESKFSQIKPVKGAGGRRYYRPTDMDLLGGIKLLLHEDGLTIKGTQKLLREKGVKHVSALGMSMTLAPEAEVAAKPAPAQQAVATVAATPELTKPPAPKSAQSAFPLDTSTPAAPKAPAFAIESTSPPQFMPDVTGGLIGRAPVNSSSLAARAAQIDPLLARLQALHTRVAG
ncbi:MAG: DNA-binding transcriptional MerR regulator [Yoonia sp.]|jgi:DNA-binding transcriptional MerR regulator